VTRYPRTTLIWLVYAAAFLAVLCIGLDGWQRYEKMAAYYAELAAEHEAMVQCIKGRALRLDDAALRGEKIRAGPSLQLYP